MSAKTIQKLIGVLMLAATASRGAIIAYDGFDYAASSTVTNAGTETAEQIGLVDLNGGSGWTGAWIHQGFGSPSADTTGASYSYSDGTNSVTTTGVAYNLRSYRNSSRTFGTLADGDYYFSILINRNTSNNAGNAKLKFTQTGTQNRNFEVGFLNGDNNLDYRVGGNSEVTNVATGNNLTNMIIGKFSLTSGTAGDFTFWLNPADLASETGSGSGITTSQTAGGGIDGIRLEYSDGANGGRFDEFRLGTTWDSVTTIPEPSSLLLIGLGLAGAAVFRRRRG